MSEGNDDRREEGSTEEQHLGLRIKTLLEDLEQQEKVVSDTYNSKFDEIKTQMNSSVEAMKRPVLELGTSEQDYNKKLKALQEILRDKETGNLFPSKSLYDQYIIALQQAIEASDAILDTYRTQFGIAGDITKDSVPKITDVSDAVKKLDAVIDVITTESPKAFAQIALAHDLQKKPEKLTELDDFVHSQTKKTSRLGFDAMSSQPFQRVPRYALLFKEIGKTLRTYDHIEPDYEDFKKYLSTAKVDIHKLSHKEVEDHIEKYFKSNAKLNNPEQIEKAEALAAQTNQTIRQEKPSMLKRFQSLRDLTKKPEPSVPSRRTQSLDGKK